MIEITEKRIHIDGVPRIVMCGELHYFRIPEGEWRRRIRLLKQAGARAVASYLPWLFHELPDATIDVTGRTRPERDIGAFIDLCRQEGLWFVARPGPFVMAELKNEGIPYRVYREHPEVVPLGWGGAPAPTSTVDYLAPAFLAECARWYDAVMPVLAARLQPSGGNVIAVQLDNEIGMLAWVSNSPDLTDNALADFGHWVLAQYGGQGPYPVGPADRAGWPRAVRDPNEKWAGLLRQDLGTFMRGRFARYCQQLRQLAEERGVTGIPFAINIHGTEGGDGAAFPIGISQLVEAYAGVPGMLSGSDHYLGELTISTATDLYVMNAFMDAVHDADQPLTSLEFEAGTGDYSGGYEQLHDPSTVELKTRLCVTQGVRLINYYLFGGGVNPPLDEAVGDGNDRLGFTGEWHGTGAPIGPLGQVGLGYEPAARAIAAVHANEPWLARMREEHDGVELAFVLDAYLTEYHHPKSAAMTDAVVDLRAHRGAGARKALARSLLLAGYRFGAVHLQRDAPAPGAVLALSTGRYLAQSLQDGLLEHVRSGGGLLLLGRLPVLDLDGRPCTALVDALGVTPGDLLRDGPHCYPSVLASGWAAPQPELRAGWRQTFASAGGTPILTDTAGAMCGAEIPFGDGAVVLLTAELPADPQLFGRAVRRLGAAPGLALDSSVPGVLATTTATPDGQRLLHVLNVTGYRASVRMGLNGEPLNEGYPLSVPPRTGYMLPLSLVVGPWTLHWANAEIREVGPDFLAFGPGAGYRGDPHATVVVLAGNPEVKEDATYTVERLPDTVRIVTVAGLAPDGGITIRFR
ncbi:beta-galactosidase [Rugosimonospora africana]|uniref:Glycoside hydrolase n=1 Tax=Rugosimonospora africana TaxID=556532 RepID=A0A8J3R1G2_9ACTN|nr:beta-galactosidase [Rugosimonospora africana]GIH20461.1 glycoside hydrolase [Rugosimonospora africana]